MKDDNDKEHKDLQAAHGIITSLAIVLTFYLLLYIYIR